MISQSVVEIGKIKTFLSIFRLVVEPKASADIVVKKKRGLFVFTQKRTQPLVSSGLSKSNPSHRDSFKKKYTQINSQIYTSQQKILLEETNK